MEVADVKDDPDFIPVEKKEAADKRTRRSSQEVQEEKLKNRPLVSCLKNEKVYVRWIPKESGMVTDPKHVLAGGMAPTAKRVFTLPHLRSGTYANPLTNEEKEFLELHMGLEPNELSVYRKKDNYWDNKSVELGKGTTTLDLSDANDYIRYKILLMNSDFICPNEATLKSLRKSTYMYVLTRTTDSATANKILDAKSRAYHLYGEMKNEVEKLALVVEQTTGRMVSKLKPESIYEEVGKCIEERLDEFLKYAEDPYLDTKLIIYKSLDIGTIRRRGQYFYLAEDNRPLAKGTQEPTIQSACEYLNDPKYQDIKFLLEAKLNR